jgi:CIC family chloride channel protein
MLDFKTKMLFWLFLAVAISPTAWERPALLGGGQNFVNHVLQSGSDAVELQTIALCFLFRFVLTLGCASSWAAGGFFMPIIGDRGIVGLGNVGRHAPIVSGIGD